MGTRPKGLVVTPDLDRGIVWMGWLRSAGYTSIGCVGPGLTVDCPRMRGARCALREAVSVALVDVNLDADAELCTRLPDDGRTILVDGSGSQARRAAAERMGS